MPDNKNIISLIDCWIQKFQKIRDEFHDMREIADSYFEKIFELSNGYELSIYDDGFEHYDDFEIAINVLQSFKKEMEEKYETL